MRVNVDNLLDTGFKLAAGFVTGLGVSSAVSGNPDVLAATILTGATAGLGYLAFGGLREGARTQKVSAPSGLDGPH